MSPNEQLEPTPFEPAASPGGAADTAGTGSKPPTPLRERPKGPPTWFWPALGGLLLLALLVVFWLPGQVNPPQPVDREPPAQAAAEPAPGTARPAPAAPAEAPETSPWSDAQAAKLRKEAQDVLAELLDIQFALEERGVEQWGAEPFAEARALAESGDELYRQQSYPEAKASYQQSLEAMRALQDSVPDVVEDLLQRALEGIEAGEPETVNPALELARTIEPENAELPALEARAANLPALVDLLARAGEAEAQGDLAAAEARLQEAAALDSQHQRTAAELARVSAAHLAQRFSDAMSDGYSALDEGDYRRARERFNAAASLQPGSAEAASALQELASAEQGSTLTRLKRSGEQYEQAEQWQQALDAYEQALKIDANVAFAGEGAQRARTRARLDSQFRAAINKPERLYDIAVAEATEKLLLQARSIEPKGPVLAGQIEQLEVLLRQANTLVPVTLVSDGETEVIVYKIARLGRFQQTELTLRPGTYTARGSRNGYRDVLEKFTITHEGLAQPISIACKEPIN